MNEFESPVVADLIGHIYEAAFDGDHWEELITLIERIHPGARVTLFGHNNGSPIATLAAHRNYAADDLRAYAQYYVRCSPFIARGAVLPVGRAFRYEIMIGHEELERTELQRLYPAAAARPLCHRTSHRARRSPRYEAGARHRFVFDRSGKRRGSPRPSIASA
jgi:alpha-beta hydrolase superfamily lysophospholipase